MKVISIPKKSLSRLRPVVKVGLILFLLLGVVAATFAGITYKHYADRAAEFDLAEVSELDQGALVLDNRNEIFGAIADNHRIYVKRKELPDHFIGALMAAEDVRFYNHPGFDLSGIARAAAANLRKQRVDQGASTITQQLARNTFELSERSFDRKMLEIFLATRIEGEYSKDEILEHYLNRIYFGNGFWGIGAAAQGYFNKDVSDLTVGESAMLCGLIRSPNPLSPFKNPEAALTARNRIVGRMADESLLERENAEAAIELPLNVVPNDGRNNQPRYLLRKIAGEARSILGTSNLNGLRIVTTIDPGVQEISEKVVAHRVSFLQSREGAKSVSGSESEALQSAAVIIENSTGRIVSAVCSTDPLSSDYDRVALTKRPAGTAFLPFVYAAAFESGKASPDSPAYDAPIDNREVMMGGQSGILGEWGAESRANRYEGKISAGLALVSAKNAASARIGFDTGINRVKEFAKQAGIRSHLSNYPSTFLGSSEVSLLELTHAYTSFANSGWRSNTTGFIDRITDRKGTILWDRQTQGNGTTHVMSTSTADAITALLTESAARRIALSNNAEAMKTLDGNVAGMTGTACGSTDNWYVGFNADYTWGIWIGYDQPREIYKHAFASETVMPGWLEIATALDSQKPLTPTFTIDLFAGTDTRAPAAMVPANQMLPCSFSPAEGVSEKDKATLTEKKPAVRAIPVNLSPPDRTHPGKVEPKAPATEEVDSLFSANF